MSDFPEMIGLCYHYKCNLHCNFCIYVGDNYYDDAVGSRKVGMPALIINRFGLLGTEEITDCPLISDMSEVFNFLT